MSNLRRRIRGMSWCLALFGLRSLAISFKLETKRSTVDRSVEFV